MKSYAAQFRVVDVPSVWEPWVKLRAAIAVLAALWTLSGSRTWAQAPAVPEHQKPRVVVMTDIGGDPDDEQSIVRFLLYSCDFHVEGLCTGFGWGHERQTRPDLLHRAVDAYGKVLGNLRKHRPDYPDYQYLKGLIQDGHNGDPHKVGPGMDSQASEWIIRVLRREDPRPVWFTIWGGPRELAQALWKLQNTVPAEQLAAIKRKIRVHSIADQDRTARWVKEHHPEVFWIYSNGLFRGIWKEGDQELVSPNWLREHVLSGHGPLGAIYPRKAAGKDGVKEGDTPSFFYVLPNGLSDPEHPEWGNWGGRFRPSGRGHEYVPTEDLNRGSPDMLYTIHRWRRAYQNAFQARMDWCVEPFEKANHEPLAVLQDDRSRNVLQVKVSPGDTVALSAAGSSDPDGHELQYHWWVYREAGTYWDTVPIAGERKERAVLTVPKNAAGRTIHVILEVTDRGRPPLTSYRRMVLQVSGEPVPPPDGVFLPDQYWIRPVTRLPGPPGNRGPWRFYRAVNINGRPVTMDGNHWEGRQAEDYRCEDKPLVNTTVTLRPPTDPGREQMIRSFRWSNRTKVSLTGIPAGTYAVYLYVWEETDPTTFDIRLNGKLVAKSFNSGTAGCWRRLGPWIVSVDQGAITIEAAGGHANFCGIEVWRQQQ